MRSLLLLAAIAGLARADAQASLVADADSVEAGGEIRVGVKFVLDPHWHVYWKNPGDSGQPPSIRWTLPPGITASAIDWPVPVRIPAPPLVTFGYEGEVTLACVISVPASYAAPTLPVTADVAWLACDRSKCVPGEAKFSMEIAVRPGEPPRRPMKVGLPVPSGLVSARYEGERILVQASEEPFFFFPAEANVIEAAAEQPIAGRGILLSPAKSRNEPVRVLRGVLTFVTSPPWDVEVPVKPAPVSGSRLTWIVPVALALVVLFFARRMVANRKERTPMRKSLLVMFVSLAVCGFGRAEEDAKPENADKAPDFKLKDLDGRERTLKEFEGKIVALEWVNHGCPYVKKHYDSGNMQGLQKKYTGKGVIWLSICSSAEGKQGWMKPEEWKEKQKALECAPTAVLLDATGEVGKLYGMKKTPSFCIVDAKGVRAYEGAIDDRPTPKKEDIQDAKNYVALVLDALLEGKPSPIRRTEPYG